LSCPASRSGPKSVQVAEDRSAGGFRDRGRIGPPCLRASLGPRLVHMPSEPSGSQWSPAVSSGASVAQVAGLFLGEQAAGQNPDKDEVASHPLLFHSKVQRPQLSRGRRRRGGQNGSSVSQRRSVAVRTCATKSRPVLRAAACGGRPRPATTRRPLGEPAAPGEPREHRWPRCVDRLIVNPAAAAWRTLPEAGPVLRSRRRTCRTRQHFAAA
jgi:hypothetical protein